MNGKITLADCAVRCNEVVKNLSTTWEDVAIVGILALTIVAFFVCLVYTYKTWKGN